MRAIAIVVVLCVVSCWTPVGADTTARSTTLEKQYQAELKRINSAISSLSDGKSRLLPDQGSGAEPPGSAMRIADWGDMPFVTVYPLSSPMLTDLKGVGPGRIIGAMRTLTKSNDPEKTNTAEPGIYMILKFDERWLGVPEAGKLRHGMCLVKVSGDAKSGFKYEKALTTDGTMSTSKVSVAIGVPGDISRVRARLIYPEGGQITTYELALDLVGIIYK